MLSHEFLDLCDGLARVESLGAGLGAVHDCVAAVDRERVRQLLKSLLGRVEVL